MFEFKRQRPTLLGYALPFSVEQRRPSIVVLDETDDPGLETESVCHPWLHQFFAHDHAAMRQPEAPF